MDKFLTSFNSRTILNSDGHFIKYIHYRLIRNKLPTRKAQLTTLERQKKKRIQNEFLNVLKKNAGVFSDIPGFVNPVKYVLTRSCTEPLPLDFYI